MAKKSSSAIYSENPQQKHIKSTNHARDIKHQLKIQKALYEISDVASGVNNLQSFYKKHFLFLINTIKITFAQMSPSSFYMQGEHKAFKMTDQNPSSTSISDIMDIVF